MGSRNNPILHKHTLNTALQLINILVLKLDMFLSILPNINKKYNL